MVASRTYKKFLSWYLAGVERERAAAPTKAGDAQIDAYARYVLRGGADRGARLRVADLVDRDEDWPGFFWNHPVSPAVRVASPWVATPLSSANCRDPQAVAAVEKLGDQQLARRRFDLALAKYAVIVRCGPRIALKAYLAACEVRDFVAARYYFLLAPGAPAERCLRHGFDPRGP